MSGASYGTSMDMSMGSVGVYSLDRHSFSDLSMGGSQSGGAKSMYSGSWKGPQGQSGRPMSVSMSGYAEKSIPMSGASYGTSMDMSMGSVGVYSLDRYSFS